MRFSTFARRFGTNSGIVTLMDDLGNALAEAPDDLCMLGGGNPAHIPAVQAAMRRALAEICDQPGSFERMIGDYDPPAGHPGFRRALAGMLREEFGWAISERNIALANGSQASFFMLFNCLAGTGNDGVHRRIHFPLAPEYIGYADLLLCDDGFRAAKPTIELRDDGFFKYRVDFDHLQLDDSVAAVCVSRPTNPTGNVLTDDEVRELSIRCKAAGVPLIIDNAYGTPFPDIIFSDASPFFDEHIIVCMSLSKFGLPGCRTGIIIASEAVIEQIAAVNTIACLATGSVGAAIGERLIEQGQLRALSSETIQPFYQAKMERAVAQLQAGLGDLPCRIHAPEGALFLWLWCPDLPGGSMALYERLKDLGVLVVPGDHFFTGITDLDWPHRYECLRITYAQEDGVVAEGIRRLCEELGRRYRRE